jgi:hypothetical protein
MLFEVESGIKAIGRTIATTRTTLTMFRRVVFK